MGLRLVMLGAPGAGKGTQAQRIAQGRRIPHISTGDIFRAHLKGGTPLGKEVQQYLDSGTLVPDELTCRIVSERLSEPDCADGFILDGFPRSLPQAESLERTLADRGMPLDGAVEVAVPDEEIVDRLTARRTCKVCGAIYNMKFTPPATGDGTRCDRPGCRGELMQRSDDCEETIRERLNVYHETTEPLLQYYRERGTLRSVPGSGLSPDAVFASIEDALAALEAAD